MDFELVNSDSRLIELFPHWMGSSMLGFDTETTGLDRTRDLVIGVCLATTPDFGWYVACGHDRSLGEPQCSPELVGTIVELLLRNPTILKVGHNIKFDFQMVEKTWGIKPVEPYDDTMLMAFLYDNTIPKGLKDLTTAFFNSDQQDTETALHELVKSRRVKSFGQLRPSEVARYGAGDASSTFKVREFLWPKIEDQRGVYSTEIELIELLISMERHGMLVNPDHLVEAGKLIDSLIPGKQQELEGIAGFAINPNSTHDVQHFVFDKLGNKPTKLTDKGDPSVAEDVLLNLPPNPGLDLILELRTLRKTKSTYVKGILEKLDSHNRLHGKLNQAGAGTGRFSSSEPNLQNLPREGSVGVSIRQAFIPPKSHLLIFLDYVQMEVRVFTHYSGDSRLIAAVKSGLDFHQSTASTIFKKPPSEVTTSERKFAKKIVFGLMYGEGTAKLARELRIPETEAKAFKRKFFETFPGVPLFMDKARSDFEQKRCVVNLLGRKRYIEFDKAYKATNTLVQGGSADIIKNALGNRVKQIIEQFPGIFPINIVHDELMLEIPESDTRAVEPIKRAMEQFHLRVPIDVDVTWSAKNWGEKLKWKDYHRRCHHLICHRSSDSSCSVA